MFILDGSILKKVNTCVINRTRNDTRLELIVVKSGLFWLKMCYKAMHIANIILN